MPLAEVRFCQWCAWIFLRIAAKLAGGEDIFQSGPGAYPQGAADRKVKPEAVVEAAPELILGSWCGKPMDIPSLKARPGFDRIPAVVNDEVYEIDSTIILQPGPAALLDGAALIEGYVQQAAARLSP